MIVSDTGSLNHGTKLKDMVKVCLKEIPGLAEAHPTFSKDTVARQMPPPHPHTERGKSYKGNINSKSTFVRNDYSPESKFEHFNNAFHKIQMELGFAFPGEVWTIPSDNKQTISLSRTAVDRHIQPKRHFKVGMAPRIPTHDFPRDPASAGETIIPSGYLVLEYKPDSPDEVHYYIDDQNRKRIEVPSGGRLFVFNRSNHFSTANITTHLNDLKKILSTIGPRGVLSLPVDGGPDWNWFKRYSGFIKFRPHLAFESVLILLACH